MPLAARAEGAAAQTPPQPTGPVRIAAAIDPRTGGRDATALAAAIARATGAELLLVAIEPDLPSVIGGNQRQQARAQTKAGLERTRQALDVPARAVLESDLSVTRGLSRVVRVAGCDLLVIGSSRRAPQGQVMMAKRTRQLLQGLYTALAVAPQGLGEASPVQFQQVAVGYDGGAEAQAALRMAARIAAGAHARLTTRGVIDDRIPAIGWPHMRVDAIKTCWRALMGDEEAALRGHIVEAADRLGVDAGIELPRGRAAQSLLALSAHSDLLVIGSRRWGPWAHGVLGGCGETLMHGARCPVLAVPRTPISSDPRAAIPGVDDQPGGVSPATS